tara:strand:+ start:64635 stop:64868 length:234 start_codon:yes stop_codon:yes gene_type:complete
VNRRVKMSAVPRTNSPAQKSSLWILVKPNPISLQREIALANAYDPSFPTTILRRIRPPVSLRRDRKIKLAHYFRGGA